MAKLGVHNYSVQEKLQDNEKLSQHKKSVSMALDLTELLNNPPSPEREVKKKGKNYTKENNRLKAIYNKYKLKSDAISNDVLKLFANHEKIVA